MAIFAVHAQATAPDPADMRFLRQGFSWGAFLWGPLWLLGHGLFVAVALWTVAFLGLCLASALGLSSDASVAIFLLLEILLGLEAHHLLERKWASQGYRLVDVIAASAQEAAETAFFRQYRDGSLGPAPASLLQGSGPPSRPNILGSFPQPEARR